MVELIIPKPEVWIPPTHCNGNGEIIRGMDLWIRRSIYNKKGKLLEREGKRSESFVQQFIQMMFAAFASSSIVNVKDTGGTNRTFDSPSTGGQDFAKVTASAAVVLNGIVVGKQASPTAVAINDFALQNLITEGTGTDQLSYGASTISGSAPILSTPNMDIQFTRSMTNSTGASVTITETALYIKSVFVAPTVGYWMIARDVNTDVVANSQSIVVDYLLRTTL